MVIDTGHLVERDAVEQDLHVLDGVDGDTRLADVADHARMIGVVAAVRGEVERTLTPWPPAGERAAVEGVGLLGGREARVLAAVGRLQDSASAPPLATARCQSSKEANLGEPDRNRPEASSTARGKLQPARRCLP